MTEAEALAVEKVMAERVSIRAYLDEPVSQENLDKILEAGRRAPSGENAQPFRFIVTTDPVLRKKIGKLAQKGSGRRFTGEFVTGKMQARFAGLTDPEKRESAFKKLTSGVVSAFLADAPLLITVVGDKYVWDTPFDCSAAIENMHLMAHALGIGACWVNACTLDVRDEIELKEMLKIPEWCKVLSIISFGTPDKHRAPRKRKPMEELVFDQDMSAAPRDKVIEGMDEHAM